MGCGRSRLYIFVSGSVAAERLFQICIGGSLATLTLIKMPTSGSDRYQRATLASVSSPAAGKSSQVTGRARRLILGHLLLDRPAYFQVFSIIKALRFSLLSRFSEALARVEMYALRCCQMQHCRPRDFGDCRCRRCTMAAKKFHPPARFTHY